MSGRRHGAGAQCLAREARAFEVLQRNQRRRGLQSLMAVLAPVLSAPLLGVVSHLPQGDWRIGTPFYFCALVQAVALGLAWMHFRRAGRTRLDAAPRPT